MNFKLHDGNSIVLPTDEKQAVNYLADLLVNRGRNVEDGVQLAWEDVYQYVRPGVKDAVSTSEIRPLLQEAMEVVIREPLDPIMSISPLFTTVQSKGMNTQILAGALGAVTAADIPEHGTYPEVMFQLGGGLQTAWVGKSGLAVSFTDEALRYSTWDIMALNLREMGRALNRHKEQKAIAFLRSLGTPLFDNASPNESVFGVTTGRGIDGQANGSIAQEDLFKAMAHLQEQGFMPNIILMNPLFYFLYVQDPVLRGMMMNHGGGSMFQTWSGTTGPLDPWGNGAMGSMGPSRGREVTPVGQAGATGVAGREFGMNSAPPFPASYFPFPVRIVTSPFVPFDETTGLGDMYLLSQDNVGYHLVDEERVRAEWRDESVEVVKVKLRERYGYAVAHEGQAVGVLKNISLKRNYWDGTVSAVSHDFATEVPARTALV